MVLKVMALAVSESGAPAIKQYTQFQWNTSLGVLVNEAGAIIDRNPHQIFHAARDYSLVRNDKYSTAGVCARVLEWMRHEVEKRDPSQDQWAGLKKQYQAILPMTRQLPMMLTDGTKADLLALGLHMQPKLDWSGMRIKTRAGDFNRTLLLGISLIYFIHQNR